VILLPEEDSKSQLDVTRNEETGAWNLNGRYVTRDGSRFDLLCALQRADDLLSGRLSDPDQPATVQNVIGWTKTTLRKAIARATAENDDDLEP
jgi:hypothetical protein